MMPSAIATLETSRMQEKVELLAYLVLGPSQGVEAATMVSVPKVKT